MNHRLSDRQSELVSARAESVSSRVLTPGWGRLAARICDTPVGFITVIAETDWLTSGISFVSGVGRDLSPAQQTIADAAARHVSARSRSLFLVDTWNFWCGPDTPPALMTIRAVAAAPVFTAGRFEPLAIIGAMDLAPHDWLESQRNRLEMLAVAIAWSTARRRLEPDAGLGRESRRMASA